MGAYSFFSPGLGVEPALAGADELLGGGPPGETGATVPDMLCPGCAGERVEAAPSPNDRVGEARDGLRFEAASGGGPGRGTRGKLVPELAS